MNFKTTDKKTVLVELTEEDLMNFGITYDEIDYKTEKTRDVLDSILQQVKKRCSLQFVSKMRIDVMPAADDGCMIIFTDLSGDENYGINESDPMIFEAKSIDDIIDCARALFESEQIPDESSLFEYENSYELLINGICVEAESIISEFLYLRESDSLSVSRIKEYAKCLIAENALEILCGKVTKR